MSTKDRSIHDGAPIECYRIMTPKGDYLYTSYAKPVTVAGIGPFVPFQISRSTIVLSDNLSQITTVDIVMSSSSELALDYAFGLSPQTMTVEIYRTHEGDDFAVDYTVEWTGSLLSVATSGITSTFKTGSVIQSELGGNIAPVVFQAVCNHQLYDIRCKVPKVDHTVLATVTKVSGKEVTVDNDGFPDNALNIGTILNQRNGESRPVVVNTSNKITVSYKFIDIKVGDIVELTRGCDHARLGNCKNVFNNVANYGGFDFIPVSNPFIKKTV